MDATQERLIADARKLQQDIEEGLILWYGALKVGVVGGQKAHAYRPLLYAEKDRVVTIQPVPLDLNEKKLVHDLEFLALRGGPLLQDRELFLIRNLARGRGVSFFDDFGYYPDFIVWLKDGGVQHMLFLDPKGLSRFGLKESEKTKLHSEIKEVEKRVREDDPNLRLHAYVLSVTPPGEIGGELQSKGVWEQKGVYFLSDADCLQKVIENALQPLPSA